MKSKHTEVKWEIEKATIISDFSIFFSGTDIRKFAMMETF